MSEENNNREPKPYRESFEHIADICRVVCLCFEAEKRENADETKIELDRLRMREDMTRETVLRAAVLRGRFALSGFEYFCVMLGIASALEGDGQCPAFSQAISHYPFVGEENVYSDMLTGKPLQYLCDIEEGCGVARRFKLKSFVLDFILENSASPKNIFFSACSFGLPVMYEDLYRRGVDFISTKELSCVAVEGRTGSGRRTLAAQICGAVGKNTAVVYADGIKDTEEFSESLTGFCVMTDSVPVVIADEEPQKAAKLVNLITELLPIAFICVNPGGDPILPRGRKYLLLRISPPDKTVRLKAWEYYLDGSEIDARTFAERYRLTVGQISGVCKSCSLKSGKFDNRELTDGIMSLNSESSVCELVHPMFGLDDLVAQDHITEALKRIIATAESLPRLMEENGFERLFPYGRGLGVLFYGASGTGKTMSAYILAAELGLDVMRVDISRIEDKYIGETEKRISEVFRKAEENNCLLFFDEADSLFAKRTEVSDSHDRHANSQTAHLLQKMEEYDGIVVLATNLGGNIDPAFKRRLRFSLEFMKPDPAGRAALWRRFVPDALPHEELDYDFLANAFDLTPTEIKWAALSAAVIAKGEPLSTEHIISALRYEYEKSGMAFPDISYKKINFEEGLI